jgi:hypothetical protein
VGVGGAPDAATCALAASTDSASADATASIVSNMGVADRAAGNAADILLGTTAATGGVCAAPAPGSPADSATDDSPVEPAGSTTLEEVDRGTAVQPGLKDLTPDSATLAAPVVPCLRRSKRVVAMEDVHTLHKVEAFVGHTPRVLVQGRKNSRRRTPSRIPLYSY